MERRASVTIASLVLGGSMLPTLVNAQQFPPPLREGTAVTGAMMLLVRWLSLAAASRYAYTTFDLALVRAAAVSLWLVTVRLVAACHQS
jgi:hypothetical protein